MKMQILQKFKKIEELYGLLVYFNPSKGLKKILTLLEIIPVFFANSYTR